MSTDRSVDSRTQDTYSYPHMALEHIKSFRRWLEADLRAVKDLERRYEELLKGAASARERGEDR